MIRKSTSESFRRDVTSNEAGLLMRFDAATLRADLDLRPYVQNSACSSDGEQLVCAGFIEQACAPDGEIRSQRDCEAIDQIRIANQGCASEVTFEPDEEAYRSLRNSLTSGHRPTFNGATPREHVKTSNKIRKEIMTSEQSAALALCLSIATLSPGCSGDDDLAELGSLTVLLRSEELIVEGLKPGDDSENIRDGWAVDFEKHIVTIGKIEVNLSTNSKTRKTANEVIAVDLTQIPPQGAALWQLDELPAGRWEFFYQTPAATKKPTETQASAMTIMS